MSRPLSRFRTTLSLQESLEPDQYKLSEVLSSSYEINYAPSTTTVRIYLQSDVTDARQERQALWKSVFPYIKEFGDSLGLHVSIIDMYYCSELSSHECNNIQYCLETEGVFELSLKEVSLCQELSAGPTFLTLLGQKYGHKPLQRYIPSHEFNLIYSSLEEQSSKQILQRFYYKDTNGVPPVHVLQQPISKNLTDWISVHDSLSKATRKGAKIALGKDPAKVQSYISSVSEIEITLGVFNCKSDINKSCYWFKRVFTDLYDQRPSTDPSLSQYSDITEGKRGLEFDPESTKSLNYLKEARLSAKYIGLDSTNIFEFLIKWQKGCGLDTEQVEEHSQYISNLCQKVQDLLVKKLNGVAQEVGSEMKYTVYQEVLIHAKHCRKLLTGIMEIQQITDKVCLYFQKGSNSNHPLVLHGKSGSGKSTLMAAAIKKAQQMIGGDRVTIMRFIGLTFYSSSIRRLLISICEQISVVYSCNEKILLTCDELAHYFKRLLQLPTKDKPLFLFLDGIDLLSSDDGALGLSWLPLELTDHVKILVSVSSEVKYRCYPVLKSLLRDKNCFIEISDTTSEECQDFLVHFLSCQNRSLTQEQISLLSDALFCLSPSPDWLAYVTLHLSSWRSFTNIETVQDTLLKLQTFKGTISSLMESLEEKHGAILVHHTFGYITAAKYGLTENELLDILSQDKEVINEIKSKNLSKLPFVTSPYMDIPTIIWSKLLHDIVPHLLIFKVVVGGAVSLQWKSRKLKETAFEKYFSDREMRMKVSGTIADYFSGVMKKKFDDELESQTKSESQPQTQSESQTQTQSESQPQTQSESQPQTQSESQPQTQSESQTQAQSESQPQTQSESQTQTQSQSKSEAQISSSHDLEPEVNKVHERRHISAQPLQLAKNSKFYNVRKLTELPHALANAERFNSLIDLLCDYHWLNACVQMNITDELIQSFSYFVPLIPIGKSLSGQLLELYLLREALILSLSSLSENPAQFSAELVSRLLPFLLSNENEEKKSIIHQLLVTALEECPSSLTPVHFYPKVSGGPLSLLSMAGHQGSITSISTTVTESQGLIIVSGSVDGTLRSWDHRGSGVLKTFDGHSNKILCISVSGNGKYVVSGGADKTVRFWLVSTAECLHVMEGHVSDVTSVAVTSKGNKTVSGSLDCTIKLWNTEQTSSFKGELLFTINPLLKVNRGSLEIKVNSSVTSLALSNDDTQLVAGFHNGQVLLLNITSGETLKCFHEVEGPILSLAIAESKDDLCIMAVTNGILTTFNSNFSGQDSPIATPSTSKLEGNMTIMEKSWFDSISYLLTDSNTSTVSIADSGNLAIAGSHDGTLHIWDLRNKFISKHTNSCTELLSYTPCGNFLISSSFDKEGTTIIKLWSSEDLFEPVTVINEVMSRVSVVHTLPDSTHFITAHYDGSVKLWKGMTDTILVREFKHHTKQVTSLNITSTEDLLITGDVGGLVTIWGFQQGRKLRNFHEHSPSSVVGTFFYRHDYIVTADREGRIVVKDFRTANVLSNQVPYKKELSIVRVGKVGHFDVVVAGYGNGCIRVWKLSNMECTNILLGHADPVTSIHLISKTSNVTNCLTTSKDGAICLWDFTTNKCTSTLVTETPITSASLNPVAQVSTLAYTTVSGDINAVWCDIFCSKNDNVILKMLSSSTPDHSPLHSYIIVSSNHR